MSEYKVISGMRAYGVAYQVGEIIELDDHKARDLVAMKRIVPHTEPVKKPRKNRSIGLPDTDDSAPTDDLDVR